MGDTQHVPTIRRMLSRPTVRISAATGLTAASAYVVSKATAITHGPVGVGVLGASLGAISLILAIGNLGFPSALPAAVRRDKRRSVAVSVLLWASLVAALLVVAASVAFAVFGRRFAAFAGIGVADIGWLGIAGFAALLVVILSVLGSVFLGSTYSAVIILASSAASALISSAILLRSPGASIPMALGVGSIGSLVVAAIGSAPFFQLRNGVGDPDDRFSWIRLVRLALSMWVAALGSGIAFAVYPVLAFAGLGDFDSGLLKAAMSISISVFYVGNAWITSHFYPMLASVSGSDVHTSEVLVAARRRTIRILAPATALVAIAAPALLWVLFTHEFVAAWPAVVVLTVGSFIRVVTALNVAAMTAARGVRGQAATEWVFATIFVGVSFVAVVTGAGIWAYLAAFIFAVLAAVITSEMILRRSGLPSFMRAGARVRL